MILQTFRPAPIAATRDNAHISIERKKKRNEAVGNEGNDRKRKNGEEHWRPHCQGALCEADCRVPLKDMMSRAIVKPRNAAMKKVQPKKPKEAKKADNWVDPMCTPWKILP
jgi:hypothetical protein